RGAARDEYRSGQASQDTVAAAHSACEQKAGDDCADPAGETGQDREPAVEPAQREDNADQQAVQRRPDPRRVHVIEEKPDVPAADVMSQGEAEEVVCVAIVGETVP